MDNYCLKTENSYQAIKLSSYQAIKLSSYQAIKLSSYQAIKDERENQIIVSLTRALEISQKYSFC